MFMAFSILNYNKVLMDYWEPHITINCLFYYFIFAPLAREKKRAHAKKILYQTTNFEKPCQTQDVWSGKRTRKSGLRRKRL